MQARVKLVFATAMLINGWCLGSDGMMASTGSNVTTIYIPLLDEGTEVVRPALELSLVADTYRVLATPAYDPSDEHWKFPPGSVVRCALEMRSGGELLVAQELVSEK